MELSKFYTLISFVFRNNLAGNWNYPKNIKLVSSGSYISVKDQMQTNLLYKFYYFFCFLISFFRQALLIKPSTILVYDPVALYAYSILRPILLFKHIIWYHNHDVFLKGEHSKISLMGLSIHAEKKSFKYLDIFSLPSLDRKKYFPLKSYTGKFFFIPNYPSLEFYNKFYSAKTIDSEIRLIYQGQISENHGLEEIINMLDSDIYNKRLKLCLKGYCSENYKEKLLKLAAIKNVSDKIEIIGVTPYHEVPLIGSRCHIGLAIFKGQDIMNSTLGTSSNKIYEYAALGLPVLLFDNEHFRLHLEKKEWAYFTDCSQSSLKKNIEDILNNYPIISKSAHYDFNHEFNYENQFRNVLDFLLQNG
ncbi:MAG: glycosyltransferase [Saprospiraceae bacterium]